MTVWMTKKTKAKVAAALGFLLFSTLVQGVVASSVAQSRVPQSSKCELDKKGIWIAGSSANGKFTSYDAQLKKLKKRIKSAAQSKKKKLKKQLRQLSDIAENQKVACESLNNTPTQPGPSQTPGLDTPRGDDGNTGLEDLIESIIPIPSSSSNSESIVALRTHTGEILTIRAQRATGNSPKQLHRLYFDDGAEEPLILEFDSAGMPTRLFSRDGAIDVETSCSEGGECQILPETGQLLQKQLETSGVPYFASEPKLNETKTPTRNVLSIAITQCYEGKPPLTKIEMTLGPRPETSGQNFTSGDRPPTIYPVFRMIDGPTGLGDSNEIRYGAGQPLTNPNDQWKDALDLFCSNPYVKVAGPLVFCSRNPEACGPSALSFKDRIVKFGRAAIPSLAICTSNRLANLIDLKGLQTRGHYSVKLCVETDFPDPNNLKRALYTKCKQLPNLEVNVENINGVDQPVYRYPEIELVLPPVSEIVQVTASPRWHLIDSDGKRIGGSPALIPLWTPPNSGRPSYRATFADFCPFTVGALLRCVTPGHHFSLTHSNSFVGVLNSTGDIPIHRLASTPGVNVSLASPIPQEAFGAFGSSYVIDRVFVGYGDHGLVFPEFDREPFTSAGPAGSSESLFLVLKDKKGRELARATGAGDTFGGGECDSES